MNGVSCRQDGGVLRIELDRPEKLNAVDTPMLEEIAARVGDGADDAVRAVVLTGAGRAVCSGGDRPGGNTGGAVVAARAAVQAITALPKPVVAGVRGPAAGFGCSLALA